VSTVYVKSNLAAHELHKVKVEDRLKGHLSVALPLIVKVIEASDHDVLTTDELLDRVNDLITTSQDAGALGERIGTWSKANLTTKLQGLKKCGAVDHSLGYEDGKRVATYTVNALVDLLALPLLEKKQTVFKKRNSNNKTPVIRNESTALISGTLKPGTYMVHDRFHSGYLNAALRVNRNDKRDLIEQEIRIKQTREKLRIRTTTSTGGKDQIASLDDLYVRRHLLTVVRETYHHAVASSRKRAESARDPSLEITDPNDLIHRWIVLDLKKANGDLNKQGYKFEAYEQRLDSVLRRFHMTVQEVDFTDCPTFADDLGFPEDTTTTFVRTINDYVRGGDRNKNRHDVTEEFALDSDGTWTLDENFDPHHAQFSSPVGFLYFRLNEYLSRGLALQVLTGDSDNTIFLDHPDMRGVREGLINHLYDNLRGILNHGGKHNFESKWWLLDHVSSEILKLQGVQAKEKFSESLRNQLRHYDVTEDTQLPLQIENAVGSDTGVVVSKIPSFYILRKQLINEQGKPWYYRFMRDPDCEYLKRADRLRNDDLLAYSSGDLIGIE